MHNDGLKLGSLHPSIDSHLPSRTDAQCQAYSSKNTAALIVFEKIGRGMTIVLRTEHRCEMQLKRDNSANSRQQGRRCPTVSNRLHRYNCTSTSTVQLPIIDTPYCIWHCRVENVVCNEQTNGSSGILSVSLWCLKRTNYFLL